METSMAFHRVFSFVTGMVALLCSSLLCARELQEPYASLKIMPEYPFGYYINGSQIERIFKANDIKVVVEVGSWIGGGSTRHFAELVKGKNGRVYAVDTWLGNVTQQTGNIHYQPILDRVYQQFLSNMIHWNLTDIVIPVQGSWSFLW
jgi:hypothetical protein